MEVGGLCVQPLPDGGSALNTAMRLDCGQGELAVMGGESRFKTVVGHALLLAILLPAASAGDSLRDLAERVGVKVVADGTSSRDLRDAALKKIPWSRMSEKARKAGRPVTEDLSQFRRMPVLEYETDPDLYRYLIAQPDVAVSTWRAMGISQLQLEQSQPFIYSANAIDGSNGTASVLWRDPGQCLFVVKGSYTSPFLPTSIEASALVWVRYSFRETMTGHMVHQEIEAFLHFPSATIEALARLAARVTNGIMDRNVFEVSLYARMMSQAARRDPDWIENLVHQMEGVPAEKCRDLLVVSRSAGGRNLPPADALPETPGPSAGPVRLDFPVSVDRPSRKPVDKASGDLVSLMPPIELTRNESENGSLPAAWVAATKPKQAAQDAIRHDTKTQNVVIKSGWQITNVTRDQSGHSKPQGDREFVALPDGQIPHLEVPQLRTGRPQPASSTNIKPAQQQGWQFQP